MAGRKSKYTPELVKMIISALEVGAYQRHVCEAAGIDEDTFANWQRRYSDFSEAVSRAKAKGWIADLAAIRKAAQNGDWRAAGEHLDRTQSPYRKSSDLNVTVRIDRDQAAAYAEQYGLEVDEVIAEAERHLALTRQT